MGDRGVSRLVSVLLSSASLSLSLPLSLTKQICRFIPLCSLWGRDRRERGSGFTREYFVVCTADSGQNCTFNEKSYTDDAFSLQGILWICTLHRWGWVSKYRERWKKKRQCWLRIELRSSCVFNHPSSRPPLWIDPGWLSQMWSKRPETGWGTGGVCVCALQRSRASRGVNASRNPITSNLNRIWVINDFFSGTRGIKLRPLI